MTHRLTDNAADELDALRAENAALKEALRTIANAAPACSAESEAIWSDRMWNTKCRDLQRIAFTALHKVEKGKP